MRLQFRLCEWRVNGIGKECPGWLFQIRRLLQPLPRKTQLDFQAKQLEVLFDFVNSFDKIRVADEARVLVAALDGLGRIGPQLDRFEPAHHG